MIIEEIDFRGKPCPEPVIIVLKKVTSMKNGDSLIVYTDLEECVELIKNTLELMKMKSISVSKLDKYWVIRVEK